MQRSFREAQYRGLPLPILWVVDYFVFDGEGLRFGRFFRTAGWYSHICMWTAFATWLLANILFQSVIRYGAYFLFFSGALQLTACLVWGVVRNPLELDIPFESGSLRLYFGSSFYVTLVGGRYIYKYIMYESYKIYKILFRRLLYFASSILSILFQLGD